MEFVSGELPVIRDVPDPDTSIRYPLKWYPAHPGTSYLPMSNRHTYVIHLTHFGAFQWPITSSF